MLVMKKAEIISLSLYPHGAPNKRGQAKFLKWTHDPVYHYFKLEI